MRLGLALAIGVAGCGGAGGSTTPPSDRGPLRLIACTPALAPPVASTGIVGGLRGGADVVGKFREGMFDAHGRRLRAPRRAEVSFGMPSTAGLIDAAVVRRVVSTKLVQLRGCFEQELAGNPALARASQSSRFAIAQDGKILHVAAISPAARLAPDAQMARSLASLDSCVGRVLRTLVFPARTSGGTIMVTQPLSFNAAPAGGVLEPDEPDEPERAIELGWTPFATDPTRLARPAVARLTEVALRDRFERIAACFGASAPRGSLRAMVELDDEGVVTSVRAGGVGNHTVETCVEQAMAGLAIAAPGHGGGEVACDFARGDAQPWRVSPAGGYGVIAATRKQLRYKDEVVVVGALEPEPLLDPGTYLVLAEPDTTGTMLELALVWANEGDDAVVAIRDGARPPLYLGMGRIAVTEGTEEASGSGPTLRLGPKRVSACVGRAVQHAPLRDAPATGALVQRLATKCKQLGCADSLVISLDPDAVARDLLEVTGAARRAGFERVLIGGDAPCGIVDEPPPARDDLE